MSAEKRCARRGCSMHDIDVTTDLDNCIGCGAELKNATEEAVRRLLGGQLDEILKGMQP